MSYAEEQVLVELRSEHGQLLSFGDALDAKLTAVFQSMAIIIGLFSALGAITSAPIVFWVGIGALALAYLAGTVRALKAWSPLSYSFPIKADWDVIASECLPRGDTEMRELLISQYLISIAEIKTTLELKAEAAKWGILLAACTVAILASLQVLVAAFA